MINSGSGVYHSTFDPKYIFQPEMAATQTGEESLSRRCFGTLHVKQDSYQEVNPLTPRGQI